MEKPLFRLGKKSLVAKFQAAFFLKIFWIFWRLGGFVGSKCQFSRIAFSKEKRG